jgi:hypothetical protein
MQTLRFAHMLSEKLTQFYENFYLNENLHSLPFRGGAGVGSD